MKISASAPIYERAPRARRAFTLIELLTVIAIIGILAAIILPTVSGVRKRAKSAQCLSNLRQLAMGCQMFAQENKDRFPQWQEEPAPTRTNPNPTPIMWYLALETYTGQKIASTTTDDARGQGTIYQCPGAELPITLTEASTYAVHTWLFLKRAGASADSLPPKISRVPRPSQVVIFGDGPQAHDGGASNSTMWQVSGTGPWDEYRDPEQPVTTDNDVDTAQGAGYLRYRHGASTNVAFMDGHVSSVKKGSLTNGNFLLTK